MRRGGGAELVEQRLGLFLTEGSDVPGTHGARQVLARPCDVRPAPAQAKLGEFEEGLAVVFCGINPGMTAATVGHHFAGRSNRFWRVIHLAGFTPEEILPENDRTILRHRCGLTATWLLMLLI